MRVGVKARIVQSSAANTASTPDAAHTYPAPGFYTVCLTVKNEYASDTKCKVVEIKSSSTDTPASGWPRLYPNPTTGIVYLPENEGFEQYVRVFDLSGRTVLETTIMGNSLDLGALPAGMYLLQCTRADDGRVMTGKVVKK
jgi:hypothetical protein